MVNVRVNALAFNNVTKAAASAASVYAWTSVASASARVTSMVYVTGSLPASVVTIWMGSIKPTVNAMGPDG